MPPKIKDLIMELRKAGFEERTGKGSHRNFKHPNLRQPVTLSGKWSGDANRYQIRAVAKAIEESKK